MITVPYEDVTCMMQEELVRKGHEGRVYWGDTRWKESELLGEVSDVDAFIASTDEVTGRVIEAAGHLRVISRFGVGFDSVDVAAATRRGVVVTNTPGVMASSVADLVFGFMLSLARQIPFADRATKAGEWPRMTGLTVADKTLGVVGVGTIGKQVVKRARGFDMRVLGYDLKEDRDFARNYEVEYVSLDRLLKESDFVSIHVDLNSSTRHMIGEEQLKLMKTTAYLVNASRGAIVDEDSLYRALVSSQIAGAGLDTFQKEPPVNSPLLQLPNLVAAPHMGAATREATHSMGRLALVNAIQVLEGRRPKFVVNPEVLEKLDLKPAPGVES